jgi:hypothetical protein
MILCLVFAPGSPLTGQEIDLEDELVLMLHFNGNALDESNENIPTLVTGPTLTADRFGNHNGAYLFDGVDDYINLNNNRPLITSHTFTICIWAKINGKSQAVFESNSFFEQRDTSVNSPDVIHFNAEYEGEIVLAMRSNYGTLYRTTKQYIYDNNWHHYVARVDEERNTEIYIDGQLYCSGIFPDNGTFVDNIHQVNLGKHTPEGFWGGAFNGVMDEIYIYNRALNPCEIEALYSGLLLDER